QQEAGAADRVVGVGVEDLLQRHLAVQLLVQGDEDGAEAAAGVRPQYPESLAVTGRGPDREAGRAVGVGVGLVVAGRGGRGGPASEGSLDFRYAQTRKALASGRTGGDGGEAALRAAAVLLYVPGDEGVNGGPVVLVEGAHRDEVLGQRAGLGEGPG